MKLLLDTHTFLWFINDDPRLSAKAKALLESEADVLLSIASLWEIAIKTSLGKLSLPDAYDQFIPQQVTLNDFELLPIDISHLSMVSTLPFHHRDPFDRLLVEQSMVEKVPIVSADSIFKRYAVAQIW
jgi:PIN domain nuclease of toxin-antitoxin system